MALTRRAKIAGLAVGLALFFLGVALVILPNVLLNRPETQAAAARYIGDFVGGAVGFEGLGLSLFPRPCVTAREVHMDLPERLAGRAAAIDICLKPLSLLQGRVAVDSARLRSPDFRLPFSAPLIGAGPGPAPDPRQILLTAVAALQRIPDGALEIHDGRLAFTGPDGRRIGFRGLNLQAQRRAAGLQWDLSGEADFLRSFSSSARLDLDAVSGSLSLKMADWRPAGIYDLLWPEAPVRLLEAHADLDVSVKLAGRDRLKAAVDGRRAALTLRRRDRETGLRIDRLAAELELGPRKLSLRIPQLAAEHPRAGAECFLSVDEDSRPRIALGLKGSGDLTAAREVTLAMLPEIPDVRLVGDILRGGEARSIQVNLQADSWAELAEADNLRVQGRLENGRVYLPWIDLHLDEVSGEALIAGGILEGRDLQAHYKGTRGADGTLRVGLSAARPVLQLDINARADLSPLPALLARLVPDPGVRREAALIQEFSGTARGTLSLDGTHRDVKVRVQASELDVQARRLDIPYPLRLQGGEFAYDGEKIILNGVDVAVGRSALYKHDLQLGLSKDLPVESRSAKAVIDLAQAFALLRGRPAFDHVQRLEGVVTFDRWRLSGQLADPATWKPELSGTVRELAVESRLLPGLVGFPAIGFDWLDRTIRCTSARGSIGRSEAKGLAVQADWAGPAGVQLRALELDVAIEDISAHMQYFPIAARQAAAFEPLTGIVRLRDVDLRARRPAGGLIIDHFTAALKDSRIASAPVGLPLDLNAGSLNWQGSKLALRIAQLSLGQSGVRSLSLAADWSAGGVLELRADDARIACGEVFERLLPLTALEGLGAEVRSLRGMLSVPHLELKGPLQDPKKWRVQAVSDAKDIVLTTAFLDEPIELPEGRLALTPSGPPEAAAADLRLDSARVRIGSDEAVLAGDIALSAAETAVQLVVTAGAVDWGRITKISDRLAMRRTADRRPLRGTLHLRLERLVLDQVHLYPLYAQVRLAPEGPRVEIQRSSFCGMPFIGRLAFDGPMMDAYLVPVVDVMPIDGVIACLSEERSSFSGIFNLNGHLSFNARREDVVRALSGRLTFVAEDGTIRQSLLFARLFAVLNLTEIYRGKLPDFRSQGLDYKRSTAHIEVKEGKILISDWSIDGPTLWIGSRGEIDIATQEIDFTIMVSPFKTVDRIINSIPGLRWILGGRLVAVPMKAVGTLEDPRFIPLSPSAVGTSILEMIERTLLLPVEIIQPLVPGMEAIPGGTISR